MQAVQFRGSEKIGKEGGSSKPPHPSFPETFLGGMMILKKWRGALKQMRRSLRSALRKRRIVARDFSDAERWDLDFWQSQTPEARLSAFVAIRNDVAKVLAARGTSARRITGEDDWMP